MKKRNIPFGYQYQNGVVTVHPQELTIIKRIFCEYQNGMSLLDIANQLNDENIQYQPGVIGWNKSRIMRLIEDERYTGKDGFPAIFDEDTHHAMMEMKAKKNTQHDTDRNHEIFHIDVPINCPVCGSEMSRRHDSRFKKCQQRWVCSNAKCRTVIRKADSDLLNDITVLLNRVIVNPELVQIPAEPGHEPSVQVRKAENEIARMLDTLNYDKDVIRKVMIECVSLKYADIESAPYIAHRLKAAFADAEPLSAFFLPLFKRTVQEIHLSKNGTVSIKLINGQMVGKDDENATGNGNAEESGTEDTCQGRHS